MRLESVESVGVYKEVYQYDNQWRVQEIERVAAQTKLFAEDPDLYERYRTANTVRVGKVLLTD
jgi:hypothetical protein